MKSIDATRFVASGTIKSAGKQIQCTGVLITGLGSDATVSIYDATGATVQQKKFSVHHQPGTSDFYPFNYLIRNGGYVEITGTAEVFIYHH